MPTSCHMLRVYETGPVSVIGFGDAEELSETALIDCRNEILDLVALHDTKILTFDLTGVRHVPSSVLGLLLSLKRRGLEVHLLNVSEEVREVLRITNLSQFFTIRELSTFDESAGYKVPEESLAPQRLSGLESDWPAKD